MRSRVHKVSCQRWRRGFTHLLNQRVHRRPKRPYGRGVPGNSCRSPWYRCTRAAWSTSRRSLALLALRNAFRNSRRSLALLVLRSALRNGNGIVCMSDVVSRDTRLLGNSDGLGWSTLGSCRIRRGLWLRCWHCRRSRRRSFTRRSAHGRDQRIHRACNDT